MKKLKADVLVTSLKDSLERTRLSEGGRGRRVKWGGEKRDKEGRVQCEGERGWDRRQSTAWRRIP
jgi:hypothetical protein